MKRIFAKIFIWTKIVFMALKWPFRICLGNYVYHKGTKRLVCNGVSAPHWRLSGLTESELVHENDFKRPFFTNAVRSFKSGYKFYMTCWFRIWVNEIVFGHKI